MELEERVLVNNSVREIIELADSFADELTEEKEKLFWETMYKLTHEKAGVKEKEKEKPSLKPMSDRELTVFENTTIEHGKKYRGQLIGSIPLSYFVWIADQPDTFKLQCKRYLAHPKIKQELKVQESRDEDE